jgi:hypothetical protein
MRRERIVELTFGELSAGSGYLITSRHILTAKHVVKPQRIGAVCNAQALAVPGAAALLLGQDRRPAPWVARADWLSDDHDLAIVKLDKDLNYPELAARPLGLVSREELLPHACWATGFPAAAGKIGHQIEATLSWAPAAQRFDLSIKSALPRNWRQWAGLSGAAVFAGGMPVGVIRTVDSEWDGLLTATPIQHLCEDAGFRSYCVGDGLEIPVVREISRFQPRAHSQIQAYMYRIDRRNAVEQVRTHLRELNSHVKPQVIAIPGLDEDEHHTLIQQLSQDPTVQRFLGRAATSEHVIVDLPWPSEETEIDADLWFGRLVDQIFSRAHLKPPSGRMQLNIAPLRQRLNDPVTPRAFWVLVRRAIAFGGHGRLLNKLLDFWYDLPAGTPVILLLCLAWNEPVSRAPTLVPFLYRRPTKPDLELERALKRAESRRQLSTIDELPLITGHHIGSWIEECRLLCRSTPPEQFDGLHVSLLNRVGNGKRLRGVLAELGELLPRI